MTQLTFDPQTFLNPINLDALPQNLIPALSTDAVANAFATGILCEQDSFTIAETIFSLLPEAEKTVANKMEIQDFVQTAILSQNTKAPAKVQSGAQLPQQMSMSVAGKDFVKSFEKLSLTIYDDANPKRIVTNFESCKGKPTVGYGHALATQEEFEKYRNGITKDEAERLFEQDIQKHARVIQEKVKVPLTQQQFDALVDFAYNTGGHGAPTLMKLLNAGEYDKAAAQMDRHIYQTVGGRKVISNGLVNRRADEKEIFLSGDYRRTH